MFELSKNLEKLGHTVIPFSMKDEKNFETPYAEYFAEPVNVSAFKPKNIFKVFYNFDAARKLQKLIDTEKPDIAHLHNFAHQLSPSVIRVLKKNKIPAVQTLHDYKLICPNYRLFSRGQACYKCRGQKFYNCALRKCVQDSYSRSFIGTLEAYLNNKILKLYDQIDLFIAPSQFMKDISVEFGIEDKKIITLRNPVHAPETEIAAKTENYLLYFGRISREKGLDALIKAMAVTEEKLKLVIVGDGPDAEYCQKLSQKLKVEHKIEFKKSLYGQDLESVILKSKAVVMPSLWPENMPLSLLESMAAGKVVIASRTGGLTELIENEKNGFLFETGNHRELAKIIDKLGNCDLELIGSEARIKVSKLSYPHHLQKIMKIYELLLKSSDLNSQA